MYAIPLVAATAVLCVPGEYVIDCGTVPIPVTSTMRILFEARDGTKCHFSALEIVRGAECEVPTEAILDGLKDCKWVARQGPGNTLIVSGTRTSRIKSVIIASDGWKPELRWWPLIPPRK